MKPIFMLLVSIPLFIFADSTGIKSTSATSRDDKPLRIFPIPDFSSNPTFGTGGGAMVMMTYKNPLNDATDTISPNSVMFMKGTYYNTKSSMLLWGNKFNIRADKIRIPLAIARVKINNDFNYTLDTNNVSFDANLKYGATTFTFYGGAAYNVWKRLYLGVDYVYSSITNDEIAMIVEGVTLPDSIVNQIVDLEDTKQSGFYFTSEWDTRDNQFNPQQGVWTNIVYGLFSEALGSTYDFQTLSYDITWYQKIRSTQTFVVHGGGENTFGDVPGNNLASFGGRGGATLRGYQDGKYRGRNLAQLQAEYRWYFYKRFGLVGFAGIGRFYGPEETLTTDELLPSAGAGFRMMLDQKQRISIRADWAWGKNGESGFYFGLTEAF